MQPSEAAEAQRWAPLSAREWVLAWAWGWAWASTSVPAWGSEKMHASVARRPASPSGPAQQHHGAPVKATPGRRLEAGRRGREQPAAGHSTAKSSRSSLALPPHGLSERDMESSRRRPENYQNGNPVPSRRLSAPAIRSAYPAMSLTCIFTCSTATKFITAESGPFAPPAEVTTTLNSASSAASTAAIVAARFSSNSANS